MFVGLLLLGVGVIYLLKNLGIIEVPFAFGEIIIPLLLILAGAYLIIWSGKFRRFKSLMRDKNKKIDDV